jgi:C_GCAxxG_C_C family probable redox protein
MNVPLRSDSRIDRRTFVRTAVACAGIGLTGACSRSPDATSPPQLDLTAATPVTPVTPMQASISGKPQDLQAILDSVESLADAHVRVCHHCAQASFLALDDVFRFGQPGILKALTPLPGIAERGETCGAVVGCLMAIGLVHGRTEIDDWAAWRASLIPARTFCEGFTAEFGSTMCGDIVERLTGQRLNLYEAADLRQFQAAGATELTSRVVRKAVRLAAELIVKPN